MEKDACDHFKEMLANAERAVVFTGAGISTESGIPDFRSPGGRWTRMKPTQFGDFLESEEVRRDFWQRRLDSVRERKGVQPNQGHLAIAKLVALGKVSRVITQNVDGLHQAGGVPDDKIIQLHGNSNHAHCLECEQLYELKPILDDFETKGSIPVCDECGGLVKTAIVMFGESLPQTELNDAAEESAAADLFMAIGSSLVVYPAAHLPVMAKKKGAALVILNREPTNMDEIADLVVNDEIGPTLSVVVGLD
ncbi:MAG: Sir2 family NAD-dependent protein deacetylase [Rhodospirillales bacterium]|jgi:NAD-dependent deacetylase|nr:Sir2 family NAD-dependent protein deacetylase [Rhodospirillales bacterium]